jgi:hypothetical protein
MNNDFITFSDLSNWGDEHENQDRWWELHWCSWINERPFGSLQFWTNAFHVLLPNFEQLNI